MRLTILGVVLGIVAAIAAAGVPLDWPTSLAALRASIAPHWSLAAVASDIVQVYAILAGLIVQVICLVALVFEPGDLHPAKAKRVAAGLDQMQQQLLALFATYIGTLALLLATKLAIDPSNPPHNRAAGLWLSAAAFMVIFSLARTIEMGRSILSVHRLRSRLLLVESRQTNRRRGPLPVEPDPTPEAYGSKIKALNGGR